MRFSANFITSMFISAPAERISLAEIGLNQRTFSSVSVATDAWPNLLMSNVRDLMSYGALEGRHR